MNTREEELLKQVDEVVYDMGYISIIKDKDVTPAVLYKIATKTMSISVLSAILESPVLNASVFEKVFEVSKSANTADVDVRIIEHPFFTKEMYDYYTKSRSNSTIVIQKLCASRYATEQAYLTIINAIGSPSNDACEALIKGPASSFKVLEALIDRVPSSKLFILCLESPFLTAELLEKIIRIASRERYSDVMPKALNHNLMTKELLLKMIDEDSYFTSRYYDIILNLPICDTEVLGKFNITEFAETLSKNQKVNTTILKKIVESLDDYGYEKRSRIINNLVDNPILDETTVITLIKYLYLRRNSGPSGRNDTSDILKKIIKLPICTESVFTEVIDTTYSSEIIKEIQDNPRAGKKTKISIAKWKNETDDNVKEFFAIEGLNSEDVISYISKYHSESTLKIAMDFPGADSKLYRKIVELIYKERDSDTAILELLKKDIPEIVLLEIIKNTRSADVVKKALEHQNANIKTAEAVVIAATRFSSESEELIKMANSKKKSIISKIYTIEKEENVTEILRRNIEDGLPTMLWGPSGVGKSSRVFEIDPTATLLILKNGMLPEEVIGGKEPNGEPGKIYPPHWYTVLCEKCEKEPDRKHVLFIDEFTNVNDTIKNLVWEVIGNRLVNGHEEFPLPPQCSLVVAGNRPEESSAVRIDNSGGVMPAPLHNRIGSMLEIKFDIDEWQKWALETNYETGNLRIHPIVYSFCVAHADKVMFSAYNPDDVTQPFLSPRTWEKLSDTIYKAEARGGEFNHISYDRIYSILGKNDVADAFISHYERLPIEMDKIEKGEYVEDDFPSVEDKLYALGIIIAKYNGDEIAIEDFIVECLGDEYLSIYKSMKSNRKAVIGEDVNSSTMSI